MIVATPVFDGSASLAAVSCTGFGVGTPAGPRNSTALVAGIETGWHGFDPTEQICPNAGLPPATPFTAQVTAASGEPVTLAETVCRWPIATDAAVGDTPTVIPLIKEMLAVALVAGFAALVARKVIGPENKMPGAV